jgi:hypothetical protein
MRLSHANWGRRVRVPAGLGGVWLQAASSMSRRSPGRGKLPTCAWMSMQSVLRCIEFTVLGLRLCDDFVSSYEGRA